MGRRRVKNKHLPPLMHERGGRYYYGRNDVALGADLTAALRKYAELHGAAIEAETFSDVAAAYLREGMRHLAPRTAREYERQMATLVRVFGSMAMTDVRPTHVRQFLTARGDSIAGTREKALLSLVFTFARESGRFDGANPCAGIRGRKSHRDVYVSDAMLIPVLAECDPDTADYVETLYRTGADAGVAALWRAENVRDGSLHVRRTKTGLRVAIELAGPLAAIIERRLAGRVGNVYLFARGDGSPIGLRAFQKRFLAARKRTGETWQLRDLRAKAASDAESIKAAQNLLGHAHESTTSGYRRRRVGERAAPITRELLREKP